MNTAPSPFLGVIKPWRPYSRIHEAPRLIVGFCQHRARAPGPGREDLNLRKSAPYADAGQSRYSPGWMHCRTARTGSALNGWGRFWGRYRISGPVDQAFMRLGRNSFAPRGPEIPDISGSYAARDSGVFSCSVELDQILTDFGQSSRRGRPAAASLRRGREIYPDLHHTRSGPPAKCR